MKKTTVLFALLLATGFTFAQKKTTTTATVTFDATTPKDSAPKAENKTVIGSINTKTGAVAFEASVKNFSFANPKMHDHFNGENWLNSTQFPKFTYTGTIANVDKVKFNTNGTYNVTVNGSIVIKGITKSLPVSGTITVNGSKINVSSNFTFKLSDFGISGQPIEAGKVTNEPKIKVNADF